MGPASPGKPRERGMQGMHVSHKVDDLAYMPPLGHPSSQALEQFKIVCRCLRPLKLPPICTRASTYKGRLP